MVGAEQEARITARHPSWWTQPKAKVLGCRVEWGNEWSKQRHDNNRDDHHHGNGKSQLSPTDSHHLFPGHSQQAGEAGKRQARALTI